MKAIIVHTRFWWTEVVRGVVTLIFGVLYLSLQNLVYALIYTLGTYLLCDGVLDLYRAIAGKRVPQHHTHVYIGGIASIAIGLVSLIVPVATLFLLSILVAIRVLLRGIQVFGEVRRVQDSDNGFRWVYALLLILLGITLLLPPVLTLTMRLMTIFVGMYAFGDGLYLCIRGLRLRFKPSTFSGLLHRATHKQLDIPENAPKTTRRAIIFVRRSGAAGLGHIGWAFEWKNGWFNTGSVENRGFHAFARPELSDFWTAHTTNPLASMQKFGKDYDEYKLFFVKQPHPRAAWRVVVWISRLSYWVIRRNCVDSTYDILRTYGITNLPDPATHYAPNDWYDSLQGPSYALAINPTIPIHISQQSHRQLVVQEIALTLIPTRVKATIPSWRQSGLRGLAEINMSWSKMASDIQASFTSSVRFITTHWKRWRKLRKFKTLHYHSH